MKYFLQEMFGSDPLLA